MAEARQLHLFGGRRQRDVAPPSAPEFLFHCMIADTLRRWATPGWLWTHLPMGEERQPITAAKLKRMGVQRGWPDFILLAPHRGSAHFLELKRRKGGKPTDEQAAFGYWCGANGYQHAFVYDYAEAIEVLKRWGAVRAGIATW